MLTPYSSAMLSVEHHLPSCVHVVVLSFIFVLCLRRRRLFLLQQHLPIERTRRIQLQPRPYALQVESVGLVTWKFHNQRVLIYPDVRRVYSRLPPLRTHTIEERIPTNRTTIFLPQRRFRHPLQLIQETIRHTLHLIRRIIGALHQALYERAQ